MDCSMRRNVMEGASAELTVSPWEAPLKSQFYSSPGSRPVYSPPSKELCLPIMLAGAKPIMVIVGAVIMFSQYIQLYIDGAF